MKVSVGTERVGVAYDWVADCACGDELICPDRESAMEWAWGHLVFTHQGESHRPPDWVDLWAEDTVLSF